MKTDQWPVIIRGIVYALVFSLPVILPFLVTGSLLFPYITGKNFYFRLVSELAFGAWAVLAVLYPRFRPRMSPIVWAFAFFLLAIGLSDALGVNPGRSFWSNNERMEGFITMLHLGALFFAIAGTFGEKAWLRLAQTSLAVSMVVFLQTLVEFVHGNARADGAFGNSTYLGIYALVHVFLALFFLVKKFPRSARIGFGVMALLNVLTIYFTGTRGSLLGLAGGLTLIALIYAIRERRHKKLRNVSFAILGVEILAAIFLVSIHGSSFAQAHQTVGRMSELTTAMVTLNTKTLSNLGEARFDIWKVALEGVKEKPVLGWGQENFSYVFSSQYVPGLFNQEQWFDRTHDVFLDWLIAGGIVGLVSYLSLFAAFLYIVWKNRNGVFTTVEQGILTGLIVAYFIHNLFVFDNLVSYVLFVFLLAYAHIKSTFHTEEHKKFEMNKARYAIPLSVGIAVVTLALPFAVNASGFLASHELISGLIDEQSGKYDQSLADLQAALSHHSYVDQEIDEQLPGVTQGILSSAAASSTKAAFIALTKNSYSSLLASHPDARGFIIYASFLGQIGDYNEAESMAEKAHELSPKKQTILFTMAEIEHAAGKDKEALAHYKEAYELDTTFTQPKLLYALALATSGNKAESERLLKEIPQSELLNEQYLSSYIELGRYDLVIAIYKQMASQDPANVQLQVSLAAAFAQAGDKTNAIATLQAIAAAHPEYKAQIDAFEAQIKAGKI